MFRFVIAALLLIAVAAFKAPISARRSSSLNLFNFGKSASNSEYKINQGSANKGTYVPEGLTKAQYEAFLKEEAKKKEDKKKKFPKGKVTESLTEWFAKATSKYGDGKAARLGHRVVKLKYEEGYAKDPSQF